MPTHMNESYHLFPISNVQLKWHSRNKLHWIIGVDNHSVFPFTYIIKLHCTQINCSCNTDNNSRISETF